MECKELYDKYAQESYQNSFDHGFWEEGENKSKGEMVMLMISELSECQEANRKDHKFVPDENNTDYTEWCFEVYRKHMDNPTHEFRFVIRDPALMSDDDLFDWWFEAVVKNTEQDEISDVAIRIMDFVYGWRCLYVPRDYRKSDTGNFSHDLLNITKYILQAFEGDVPGRDWGYALAAVCEFCTVWGIDLDGHISLKQRYNRGRPFKHSKKY